MHGLEFRRHTDVVEFGCAHTLPINLRCHRGDPDAARDNRAARDCHQSPRCSGALELDADGVAGAHPVQARDVEVAVHGLVVGLTSDTTALWAVLTTVAHSQFDDNCSVLLPGSRKLVGFVPVAEA